MQINFHKNPHSGPTSISFIQGKKVLSGSLLSLNANEYIRKTIEASKLFQGKEGDVLHIPSPKCCNSERLFIFSLGNEDEIDELSIQRVGAKIADVLNAHQIEDAEIHVNDLAETVRLPFAVSVSNLLFGLKVKNYNFNRHFKDKADKHKIYLKSLSLISSRKNIIEDAYKDKLSLAEGILLTRDLVSEPANILTPEKFMERCYQLRELGVKVTVLDQSKMLKLGMGALLGVAQGSAAKPYAVVMEWKPRKHNNKCLALVGKGVCFDSGGINIKPSAGMGDMKYDKAGAATVVGAMHAIASREANAHVIGVVGLVENMPSGTAQRPSDVVVTMSGQTVEVGNTDAEGRLVLADIMHYVQTKYNITHMIDIATLTGAIVVALGETYAGLFSNAKTLSDELVQIGENTGDLLWPMPMHKNYDKQIDSNIADISNDGSAIGRGAGASTAAHFLKRFVKEGCLWAHLDIAGMAWSKTGTALSPKGATGFGVKLFDGFVRQYIEK
jgi:leucyl aminopeptidase